ncbi:MAG: repressor LexA, partial [Verrucomicrobiales bacterium]
MLTKRQQEVYDYLKDYHQSTGLMPSTREIQRHFEFASQTAAVSHLRALEKKGVIQKHAGKARALVLPEELERDEIIDVPIYGHIAAGMAQEAEQEQDG